LSTDQMLWCKECTQTDKYSKLARVEKNQSKWKKNQDFRD